jgi:hypothetical protein
VGDRSGKNFLELKIKNAELRMKISRWAITFFIVACGQFAGAQDTTSMYDEALKLRGESKFPESLVLFQALLKNDSFNVDYLQNTAYLLCKTGF